MEKFNMVDLSNIGDIREKREKIGLSQCKVAKHCGVSIQAYYRWENGLTKQIKDENYKKLCEILNVKVV